jgi:flagellar motility protein MotE (MotC chaperone)
MKPKDAAKIFNDLDMNVLIDVMQSMKERKIAPIVAAMDAERARNLTQRLAERQSVPSVPK